MLGSGGRPARRPSRSASRPRAVGEMPCARRGGGAVFAIFQHHNEVNGESMSNEISRRSILTAAAATAGIAATNAFIWTPAAARAEPVTGLHAVGGKPSLNEPLDTVMPFGSTRLRNP